MNPVFRAQFDDVQIPLARQLYYYSLPFSVSGFCQNQNDESCLALGLRIVGNLLIESQKRKSRKKVCLMWGLNSRPSQMPDFVANLEL